jgi:transposase
MGQTFHPYEPDQGLLFPPSPREWLPDGHLAHFVSDTIDALDLAPFLEKYAEREDGRGQLAYHPALMLKVLVYAYCVGLFSSRKIAAATLEHVALRYLSAGLQPSHRTIARFRLENLGRFQALFVEVVRIAREAGLVSMGALAVDGSKLKASASKHKAMSYGRMKSEEQRLRDEIRRITDLARQIDEAEDAQFCKGLRGDELPQELCRRKGRADEPAQRTLLCNPAHSPSLPMESLPSAEILDSSAKTWRSVAQAPSPCSGRAGPRRCRPAGRGSRT